MKAFINLGCHGRKAGGITMCVGTNNRIADLRRLRRTPEADKILDYLDKHCKLFDSHASDLNKIGNIINLLEREGVMLPQTTKAVYDWIAMHKRCGVYMYVDPLDPDLDAQ